MAKLTATQKLVNTQMILVIETKLKKRAQKVALDWNFKGGLTGLVRIALERIVETYEEKPERFWSAWREWCIGAGVPVGEASPHDQGTCYAIRWDYTRGFPQMVFPWAETDARSVRLRKMYAMGEWGEEALKLILEARTAWHEQGITPPVGPILPRVKAPASEREPGRAPPVREEPRPVPVEPYMPDNEFEGADDRESYPVQGPFSDDDDKEVL